MTSVAELSAERVLLLATYVASEGQIDVLRALYLQRPDILQPIVIYRIILTFCAYNASTEELLLLLQALHNGVSHADSADTPIDICPVQALDERATRRQVEGMSLRKLPGDSHGSSESLLLHFLQARAYQIDSVSDDILPLAQLVTPFVEGSLSIRDWFVSRLLPLLRLKYEYYPGSDIELALHELDTSDGRAGVNALLQYAEKESARAEVGRDLRSVVAPWMRGGNNAKRRRLEIGTGEPEVDRTTPQWQDVNEWMLSTSLKDLPLAERAFLEWNGADDIDLGGFESSDTGASDEHLHIRYSQVGLAIIYASMEHSAEAHAIFKLILKRASEIAGLLPPFESQQQFNASLINASRAAFLLNALLKPDNDLTRPSTDSLTFLYGLIESVDRLGRLKHPMTIRQAAELCLFGTEEQQRQELCRLLQTVSQNTISQNNWLSIRDLALWLQSWRPDSSSVEEHSEPTNSDRRALIWRMKRVDVEAEVLNAMLSSNQYNEAVRIYANDNGPLPWAVLEEILKAAIFNAYDNASNGNRTRGGMKRAYDILKAFQPYFLHSPVFRQINSLIAATHALSFYQITLQHGVPFRPVSIRAHKDPTALLEIVLAQNERAYTKLDDLLNIGRNFVEAGLPTPRRDSVQEDTLETKYLDVEHRITYLAITSALDANDFDTAYSYTTTRLSQAPVLSDPSAKSEFTDDTSWRAAYAAGRHRPPITPPSLHARISALSRRMELLSLALILAPTPEPLSEILATWRGCEDELDALKANEAQRNREFDQKAQNRVSLQGLSVVPGGFGVSEEMDREGDREETARLAGRRRAEVQKSWKSDASSVSLGNPSRGRGYDDEAPMGLFEVARGAANAFQRSARGVWGERSTNSQLGDDGSRGWANPMAWNQRANMGTPETDESRREISGEAISVTANDDGRLRKRDRVSNMVTGGLVSGIGWMLGAQPLQEVKGRPGADEDEEEEEEEEED